MGDSKDINQQFIIRDLSVSMAHLAVWCLTAACVVLLGTLTEGLSPPPDACWGRCSSKRICVEGRPKCREGKKNCERKYKAKCFRDPCRGMRCNKRSSKCVVLPQTDLSQCTKKHCVPTAICANKAFPCSEIRDRAHLDEWSDAMYIPKPTEEFETKDKIIGWHFYARRAGEIEFMVMRPSKGFLSFTIMDKTTFYVPKAGEHTIDLDKEHQLRAKKGDVIGFYFPGDSIIPFDRQSGCSSESWTAYIDDPSPSAVDIMTLNKFSRKSVWWHPCRLYALRAITKKSPPCPK